MSDLKDLVAERRKLKSALTRFRTFFDSSAAETSIEVVEKRLQVNEPLLEKFDKIQSQIEELVRDTESAATHANERDTFEKSYFELITEVEKHVAALKINKPATQLNLPCSSNAETVTPRLPTIVLPEFDGNYDGWLRFRDTFESLIHSNEALTDIQRFHYLNSALTGPAARVIQSLGVSETNYKLAWSTLKRRFEDPTSLIFHHANALVELPPLQRQCGNNLQEFIDTVNNHVLALGALGESVDTWDTILILILTKKLDSLAFRKWEERVSNNTNKPRLSELLEFLEQQAKYLERAAMNKQPNVTVSKFGNKPNSSKNIVRHQIGVASQQANKPNRCLLCKNEHLLQYCGKLKAMSHAQMHDTIKRLQCCFNCLQLGHSVKNCTRASCRKCGSKHHTILHRVDSVSTSSTPESAELAPQPSSSSTAVQSCISSSNISAENSAILATALVYIEDNLGNHHECYALLDVGSQAHFITESFCHKLGLSQTPTKLTVGRLGGSFSSIRSSAQVVMRSRCNNFSSDLSCLVIKDIIEDMPNTPFRCSGISVPAGITLADPKFSESKRIDLLIGAGLFWQLLCVGQHKVGSGLLWQKTRLGWVLGGCLSWPSNRTTVSVNMCHTVADDQLHQAISKFWEIENVTTDPVTQPNSALDICEQYFKQTTTRHSDGRYIVSIPFNNSIHELGESRAQAERRLINIERKFVKQPELHRQYVDFMSEYERLGHMTHVDDEVCNSELGYYLPHHAVFKESSSTTKIRVVFDGSAKTTSGISLNDAQLVGPTVQSDLVSILIRFRIHKFILSADIEKMYRQVLVQDKDRRFQQILWRSNSNFPIKTYRLNTVTYGTAAAPFLATRVLREIGEVNIEFSAASHTIIHDFYVDDLLTGCESLGDARKLRDELTCILGKSGFLLRKWASNDNRILTSATDARDTVVFHNGDKDPKTLGLLWLADSDELRYAVKDHSVTRTIKRTILSQIAQIFEPLGLIGPIITRAKIIMQQLWQLQLGWDETLPQHLHTQWCVFRAELQDMQSLFVTRRVVCDNAKLIELHGFSDASEKAYGACVYLRTRGTDNVWSSRLLCAKSRVAPLKAISLPRLELCAALLLSQLVSKIKNALHTNLEREYYWSDSMIVLAWIRSQPTRWKTFVANRTSEVRQLTNADNWSHVVSEENPADLISRGASPHALAGNRLWWYGPVWLTQEAHQWPVADVDVQNLPEERSQQVACFVTTDRSSSDKFDLTSRFSCYSKLIRVTAYCIRFIRILIDKHRGRNNNGSVVDVEKSIHQNLLSEEIKHSERVVVKLVQRECFDEDIRLLVSGKQISTKSKLVSLNPLLDQDGLLRVGGRITNASVAYDQKHPMILPSNHTLTKLIINYEHNRLLHAGCQLTLASLRTRFWPLSGKRTVKGVLHRCVRCFRTNPKPFNYMMGNLPASRLVPARAFSTCGVDYAGPFLLKERGRSRVTYKGYICIFVCFVTKAVHIELATDLSTDAFLNCMYRFISRRGRINCIYSDNGTNFIGAKNQLNDLGILLSSKEHNERVQNCLSQEQMQWHLIPPHAPHFGGLWEGAVKSVKGHLRRVIGDQRLTFEELYTVLTQVEACLNSRPLHPLSSDPDDLLPLTPGHFLIGDAIMALPQPDLCHLNINRLNRYQLIQQTVQHFWKRWQQEYLHELQQRIKWQSHSPVTINIGSLVVIREDNLPPLKWRLGRIVELHPGSDGVIRVVSLKVADGNVKRPVTKICLLPIAEEES